MKKLIRNAFTLVALVALATSAQFASAQVTPFGPGGGGEAGNRTWHKNGHLDRNDRYLQNDHSYFETWTVHLQAGKTYRLTVTSKYFQPYLWVQHPGHIHTNKAIRSAQPRPVFQPFGPGGGGEATTTTTVLTFTPGRSGNYTFVINSMRGHKTGSYRAVLQEFGGQFPR
jgi:hypothetical protein